MEVLRFKGPHDITMSSARTGRAGWRAYTANKPFGQWGEVFPDPAMTVAAADRLVHHSTIFEMNVESYRRRAAAVKKGPGRPATRATPKNTPDEQAGAQPGAD